MLSTTSGLVSAKTFSDAGFGADVELSVDIWEDGIARVLEDAVHVRAELAVGAD